LDNATYVRAADLAEQQRVYTLDLRLSQARLFAHLSENRRRELRDWNSQRSSLVLERDALRTFVIAHYRAFMMRRGASRAYLLSDESLHALCSLDDVLLVGAGRPGRVEAVAAFGYTADVGDYLFSISAVDGHGHGAALVWYGVQHLKWLGVPALNLGGGVRPNDGVAQFKERFGATQVPLRSLKQVYRPDVYRALCARRQGDGMEQSGYFPPYHAISATACQETTPSDVK
jgi:hypothetical protein